MKQVRNLIALVLFVIASACNKAENKIFLEGGTPPTISASTETVVLEPGLEANQAIVFKWTNPNYRFTTGVSSQDVTYTLEIDTVGANFNSSIKYTNQISSNLSLTYTVGELNAVLGNSMFLQLEPRRDYDLEARVIASIGSAVKLVSTNKVAFKAKPFPPPPKVQIPENNEIWLVGDASLGDWNNPLKEPYLTDQKFTKINNTKYELVINLNPSKGYLVLPVMGNWNKKYCLDNGVDRSITTNGGNFMFRTSEGQDFLSPADAGTYKLTFDFQLGKFSVVKQ
jgi:hypothetical protein